MKTKIFLIVLFVLITSSTLLAQQHRLDSIFPRQKYTNAIGLGAGFTTGYGISYRYFPFKNGIQFNFFPYYADYGKRTSIDVGITFLHTMAKTRRINLYLYLANHYHYSKRDSVSNALTNTLTYYKKDRWDTGIGAGIEWDAEKRIVIELMGGFAQYNSLEKLFLTGEMALYYKFK